MVGIHVWSLATLAEQRKISLLETPLYSKQSCSLETNKNDLLLGKSTTSEWVKMLLRRVHASIRI